MLILFIILAPLIIGHLLIMWHETEFFAEYSELFHLHKLIPFLKKFVSQRKAGSPLNFKEFLTSNYDNFIIKLITCPVCLSTVLAFFLSLIASIFGGIILGAILWLPTAYLGLFLYEKMKKLIK